MPYYGWKQEGYSGPDLGCRGFAWHSVRRHRGVVRFSQAKKSIVVPGGGSYGQRGHREAVVGIIWDRDGMKFEGDVHLCHRRTHARLR